MRVGGTGTLYGRLREAHQGGERVANDNPVEDCKDEADAVALVNDFETSGLW